MIVFDNSIFCLTLHPDAKPRLSVDRVDDRIQYLLETLRDNKEVAIVPTPVLSEFLVFAGKVGAGVLAEDQRKFLFFGSSLSMNVLRLN